MSEPCNHPKAVDYRDGKGLVCVICGQQFVAYEPKPEMLVVHHDDDTPENRAAAEKALKERGVTEVRHTTAYDIFSDRHPLRSDGYIADLRRQPDLLAFKPGETYPSKD